MTPRSRDRRRAILLGLLLPLQATASPPAIPAAEYQVLSEVEKLREANQLELAIERLETLLQGHPSEYARALAGCTLGYLLRDAARLPEAIEAWTSSLENDQLAPQIRHDLRLALLSTNLELSRYQAARDLLEGLLAETPEPPEEWLSLLAGLLQELGLPDQAVTLLERRLEAFPASRAAWDQLAAAYQAGENPERTLALLELGRLQGVLDRPEDHLRLARWKLHLGLAFEAHWQLTQDLEAGRLTPAKAVQDLLEAAQKSTR